MSYPRLVKSLGLLILVLVVISSAASLYFFHVAQVRSEKSFIDRKPRSQTNALYAYEEAFDRLPKRKKELVHQGLKQVAWYVPAKSKSHKTAIVVHGFGSQKEDMKPYAYLFYQLGYNVLMPDNMAHGESEGQLIGYGWKDKDNIIAWANQLLQADSDSRLALFGVSMGGAGVMMASGDEKLPQQVDLIIADAGYTSVWQELKHQAKAMYGLPAFPLLYQVSGLSKLLAGFSYGEASAVEQLKKSALPTLFIHGAADDFVPASMLDDNYQAHGGPKARLVIDRAKHVKSFETDPEQYQRTIAEFVATYQDDAN